MFQESKLKITIQCNLKIVDYLNVTFNLTDSSYRPFSETNNEINYIHKQSNSLLPSLISYLYLSKDASYFKKRKSSTILSPHSRKHY